MNQYSDKRPLAVQVNQFSHHPNKRQFSFQGPRNQAIQLDAFQSTDIKSIFKSNHKSLQRNLFRIVNSELIDFTLLKIRLLII